MNNRCDLLVKKKITWLTVTSILGWAMSSSFKKTASVAPKIIAPTLSQTWTCHFGAITARIFSPREMVQQGIILDISRLIVSYGELYTRFIRDHIKVNLLKVLTSTFVEFWENLNLRPRTMLGRQRLDSRAHPNMRWLTFLWISLHRFKRFIAGFQRARNNK